MTIAKSAEKQQPKQKEHQQNQQLIYNSNQVIQADNISLLPSNNSCSDVIGSVRHYTTKKKIGQKKQYLSSIMSLSSISALPLINKVLVNQFNIVFISNLAHPHKACISIIEMSMW
ncbi:hypothetical protein ACTA71_005077 [Dictyostelium dimigraforme]